MHRLQKRLVDAAAELLDTTAEKITIIAVRGIAEVLHPEPPPLPIPPGVSDYDAAILRSLADRPLSARRLARFAGHRHNSYFRERLAALVDAGHVRYTRRGYSRPRQ